MTTWVKVFNSLPSHPKVVAAGPQAAWLFICGLCYANEHLTDGFIPTHSLPVVAPGLRASCSVADRLVSASLWHPVENGWQIHGYAEHQRSGDEVRERRAKDRQRKASGRSVHDLSARTPQGIPAESRECPKAESATVRDLEVEVEGRRQRAEIDTSVVRLCRRLADHIARNDSKADPKPESDRWLTDMRLLVADRNGDVGEVERIVDWCQADPFWRSNILSPGKLRKQFTQMVLRADTSANVMPMQRPAVARANAWQEGYRDGETG